MARPPFKPTATQRAFVEGAALGGLPHERIAERVGCSVDTLVKYFRKELDAVHEAHSRLAKTAFDMALNERNPAMVMFLCKTRLNWSEKQHVDITTGGEKLTWRDKVDDVKDAREAVKVFAEGVQGDE